MIPLERWCKDLLEPPFRHPDWDDLVEHNRNRCRRLLESSPADQWVHGDLHHGNLLVRADGSDVVIDPKGVFGDPAFDACTFVRNQIDMDLPEMDLRSRLAERLIGFGEGSGLPLGRCVAWAAAGNTLSEIWDAEGVRGDGFARRLRYVRILSEMADEMGE
jgi:streptomycin 6-kinase